MSGGDLGGGEGCGAIGYCPRVRQACGQCGAVEGEYFEGEGVVSVAARGDASEAGSFLASAVGGLDVKVAGEGCGGTTGEFLD